MENPKNIIVELYLELNTLLFIDTLLLESKITLTGEYDSIPGKRHDNSGLSDKIVDDETIIASFLALK